MIFVNDFSLNIEISETVITVKDYKEYLNETKEKPIDYIEQNMRRVIDEQKYVIDDDLPLWGITWTEAAKYCNWLSKKENLTPCYVISENILGIYDITVDQNANGYRMPYVRELLFVSGIKDGLSKEQYEKENTGGIKYDGNNCGILSVNRGKKNKYGIYDVLGNISQFCNDFNYSDYDYYDYSLSAYGPNKKQIYSRDEMRCCFGGMYFSTYEDIQKQVIFDINENDKWSFSGIRLVRKHS